MPRRKPSNTKADGQLSANNLRHRLANLFAKTNRGLLLDVFVFVMNVFLMRLLTKQFIDLFSQVSAENPIAKLLLGLTFLAMWILPAMGAVLIRCHFQQRLEAEGTTVESEDTTLAGGWFSPL